MRRRVAVGQNGHARGEQVARKGCLPLRRLPLPDPDRRVVALRPAGTDHRRCARPGCGAAAAVTLRFHATRREAALVPLDQGGPRAGDLCRAHARDVRLPRGWALCDARPLVAAAVPAPPAAPPPAAPGPVTPLSAPPRRPARIDVPEPRTPLLQRAFRNVLP